MEWVRLGDIATTITKGTTPTSVGYRFQDNGINFVKVESITENGIFVSEKFAHINEECNEKLARSQLQENDLLFSIAGAIGRTAIVNKNILPANTNQALAIIRIPEDVINYSFLMYVLRSPLILRQYDKLKQGVAQINLSLQNVKDFRIPKISLKEQEKIAEVLDKVNKLIDGRKHQLDKLDELVKSRFVEMFGDPVSNPKEWNIVKIGDIATEVKYGTSLPAVEDGKYPYLRMNNMTNDGHIDLSNLKYIDVPDDEIEKCIVRKGDVLFNRTNSVELVGKTCVFDLDEEMIIAGYIIRVRLHEAMLPIVFSSYMNTAVIKQYLRKIAKGAVNQANINAKELQAIQIYLPPLDLQNQFADFVAQVDKSKLAVQKSLEQLEILKKSLMQAYFG